MQEGRSEYRFAPLDTAVWLRNLIEGFQSEIGGKGVSVDAGIPEGLLVILADGEAPGFAADNLRDSAAKYSPVSKTIGIAASAGNGAGNNLHSRPWRKH